jgi:hypothetical protein
MGIGRGIPYGFTAPSPGPVHVPYDDYVGSRISDRVRDEIAVDDEVGTLYIDSHGGPFPWVFPHRLAEHLLRRLEMMRAMDLPLVGHEPS